MTNIDKIVAIINLVEYIVGITLIVIFFKKQTRIERKTDELMQSLNELREAHGYGQYKDAEHDLIDIEADLNAKKDWKP